MWTNEGHLDDSIPACITNMLCQIPALIVQVDDQDPQRRNAIGQLLVQDRNHKVYVHLFFYDTYVTVRVFTAGFCNSRRTHDVNYYRIRYQDPKLFEKLGIHLHCDLPVPV